MFDNLFYLIETDPTRGYLTLGSMVIIFLFLLWVSIIDIKKQSITFWKMLVASFSVILMPLIVSFFCGCKDLKWFLMGAIVLWIFLLFLNVKFNKDRFVGKADIDLLSALFAENVMFCAWMFKVLDPNVVWIRITHAWYSFFLYLLIGAIIYIILFLIAFTIKVIMKKATFKELIKGTKVSVIPMLMPISIMVPYMIMVS